jgi:hypothetical protein
MRPSQAGAHMSKNSKSPLEELFGGLLVALCLPILLIMSFIAEIFKEFNQPPAPPPPTPQPPAPQPVPSRYSHYQPDIDDYADSSGPNSSWDEDEIAAYYNDDPVEPDWDEPDDSDEDYDPYSYNDED